MGQSKRSSFIEQLYNVGSGFIVSLIYWTLFIVPQIEGREITFGLNLWITLQFTVLSVVRGYIWRRVFNYYLAQKAKSEDYTWLELFRSTLRPLQSLLTFGGSSKKTSEQNK